ncbi:MAG: hypothetical protein Q6J68_03240 [Thermostichales cyanobacterium SZTDM-1c_bins_54]
MHSGRRTYSIALQGWVFWIGVILGALVLRWAGLGWLALGLVALLIGLLSLPIWVVLGFRWWAERWLTTAACPVCEQESQAIEGQRFHCPHCGVPLYVADGLFYRQVAADTIDIDYAEE